MGHAPHTPAFRRALRGAEQINIMEWPSPANFTDLHDPEMVAWDWLPVLGPTSAWIALRLAAIADENKAALVSVNLEALGEVTGLHGPWTPGASKSPPVRAIERMMRYGLARWRPAAVPYLHVNTRWRLPMPSWLERSAPHTAGLVCAVRRPGALAPEMAMQRSTGAPSGAEGTVA